MNEEDAEVLFKYALSIAVGMIIGAILCAIID